MIPLRDPAAETGHADRFEEIPDELDPERVAAAIPGEWRLDRFRERVPGAHFADLEVGTTFEVGGRDTVSCGAGAGPTHPQPRQGAHRSRGERARAPARLRRPHDRRRGSAGHASDSQPGHDRRLARLRPPRSGLRGRRPGDRAQRRGGAAARRRRGPGGPARSGAGRPRRERRDRRGSRLELRGIDGLGGETAMTMGILDGMRVVEGSAFVAAPLGGMTLAQLGADVIRFDPIGGGLDRNRWPVTEDGKSLFWAGMNKGKRSIQVDLRSPAGQELATALITAPGDEAGLFLTNFPARGWLDYEALREGREDLIMVSINGNYDGTSAVDYTVNPATGFPWATGPRHLSVPFNHLLPAWDAITGHSRRGRDAGGRAAPDADRRGPAGQGRALRRRLRDGRQPRQDRRGADLPPGAAQGRQLPLRRLRPRLPDQGGAAHHDRRVDPAPVAQPGRGDRSRRGLRDPGADARCRPGQGGGPVRGARGDRRDAEAVDHGPHAGRDPGGLRRARGLLGPLPDVHGARRRTIRAARPRTRCSTRSSSRGSAPT